MTARCDDVRMEALCRLGESTRRAGPGAFGEGAAVADDFVAEHLASCGECRRELNEMSGFLAGLQSVPVPEPGDPYWRSLPKRIVSLSQRATASRAGSARAGNLAAVAAALLLVVSLLASRRPAPPIPAGQFGQAGDTTVLSSEDELILDSIALLSAHRTLQETAQPLLDLPATIAASPGEILPLPMSMTELAESGEDPDWAPFSRADRSFEVALEALSSDEAAGLVAHLRTEIESRGGSLHEL